MPSQNFTILPASDLSSASTEDTAALRDDINIGIEHGIGQITAYADSPLRLEIGLTESAPQWAELSWISGSDVLCRHPHVVLRLSVTSEAESWMHPALRLHGAGTFRDVFASDRLPIGETPEVYEVVYDLSPRHLEGCGAIDLQLFFEPRPNSFALHSLSLTAFR